MILSNKGTLGKIIEINPQYEVDKLPLKNQKISKNKFQLKQQEWQNSQNGHWTINEQKLYLLFLRSHLKVFLTNSLRKNNMFHRMSNNIQSRSRTQCTSHHQKMLKKHGSVEKIIQSLNAMMRSKKKKVQDVKGQMVQFSNTLKNQQFKQAINSKLFQLNSPQEQSQDIKNHIYWLQANHQRAELQRQTIAQEIKYQLKEWDQIQAQISTTWKKTQMLLLD